MNVRELIKRSPPYQVFVHLRYIFIRYVKNANFNSVQLYYDTKLEYVDKSICFFGYYNISPTNSNNDTLFLKVQEENVRGSQLEPASIMLRKNSGEIIDLPQTRAWNWQQGCMLQWVPGRDDRILFNDYEPETDRYVSKVINTSGQLLKIYPMPVNNVSKCGKFALSLNYDRLLKMRPDYAYFNRKNNTLPEDDQDGIWHLDLDSGHAKLIITLEDLKSLSYSSTMDRASHKVNHIDINPGGSRFMFLHRWVGPQGRFMRLVTANSDGSDLFILNGDIMTSHSCWLSDSEILSFCEYKGQRGYFKFVDKSASVISLRDKFPQVDGHPSLSPRGRWIITDTYPDKSRMSYLYLYDSREDRCARIGRFYQPLKYSGEMRIDAHPKWGADGKSIFFESGHSGKRRLYKIEMGGILSEYGPNSPVDLQ